MTQTPQQVWDELRRMVEQWRGQSVTIARCWPADAGEPPAAFSGVITTVTAAGFLVARTVEDPDNPRRQAPATVRVFVQWSELWGPDALTLEGRVRYRTPGGTWRVEPVAEAVAGWLRRYQAAVTAALKEANTDGLEDGSSAGGSRRARPTARTANAAGHPLDRPVPFP